MATSRQALGIAGEQVWRVPSLGLPDARRIPPLAEIARSEAVRLFLDRARLSRPGFDLTEGNAGPITEVCQRLDGMPLAIELAAARLRMLSVGQIATLLDDRFRLLTSGSRAALPRQRTLRATVDWSYDLLSEVERALFDRLCAFAGGWTLEAAEAICSGPGIVSDQILDLMTGLVEQSLVLVEVDDGGTTRYQMLETLRQYGQERLAERGEAGLIQRQHVAYYVALAEAAEPELTGPQQVAWLDRLEREHGNLRAALRGSFAAGDAETAAHLCGMLGWFWYDHSHLREGSRWLDGALSTCGTLSMLVRARALLWAGLLGLHQEDYARSQAQLEESLHLWQALGEEQSAAFALNVLGGVAREQGDYERASCLYRAGLVAAQKVGDTRGIALARDHLGDMAQLQGDDERAATLYEESLTLFREVGDLRRTSVALMNLGNVAIKRGDLERALTLYREGLELAQAVRDRHRIAEGIEGVANSALLQGRATRAARLFGAAEAVREAISVPVPPSERAAYVRRMDAVCDRLGEAAYAAARVEGRAMTPEQAIGYALAEEQPVPPPVHVPGSRSAGGQAVLLTPRETEVAVLVARGLANREIAAELVIAEGTAANHVHHILTKLGVHSRKQIARWAAERGLHPGS
jgi:predicted ATPase/DNA-binding NarL/FixJ family response regulator